jgi:hypothetical protein
MFTQTYNLGVLDISRIFTGFFQVFFTIYLPCWADCFGNENQKSAWLAYLILASPVGQILGYAISAGV